LPRIFARTGAVLVYATTEPTEALMLGGSTATLSEGRVTQFGSTPIVYRHPDNIEAARVFSDPPLNELSLRKVGPLVSLENGRNLPAFGVLSRLPDGAYRLGFRAEAVVIGEARPSSLSFPGEVAVTEISGTESLGVWVALTEGVHDWQPGAKVDVRVDAERAFVFDAAGKLAATPTIAKTG